MIIPYLGQSVTITVFSSVFSSREKSKINKSANSTLYYIYMICIFGIALITPPLTAIAGIASIIDDDFSSFNYTINNLVNGKHSELHQLAESHSLNIDLKHYDLYDLNTESTTNYSFSHTSQSNWNSAPGEIISSENAFSGTARSISQAIDSFLADDIDSEISWGLNATLNGPDGGFIDYRVESGITAAQLIGLPSGTDTGFGKGESSEYLNVEFKINENDAFNDSFTASQKGKDGEIILSESTQLSIVNDIRTSYHRVYAGEQIDISGLIQSGADIEAKTGDFSLAAIGTHEGFNADNTTDGKFTYTITPISAHTIDNSSPLTGSILLQGCNAVYNVKSDCVITGNETSVPVNNFLDPNLKSISFNSNEAFSTHTIGAQLIPPNNELIFYEGLNNVYGDFDFEYLVNSNNPSWFLSMFNIPLSVDDNPILSIGGSVDILQFGNSYSTFDVAMSTIDQLVPDEKSLFIEGIGLISESGNREEDIRYSIFIYEDNGYYYDAKIQDENTPYRRVKLNISTVPEPTGLGWMIAIAIFFPLTNLIQSSKNTEFRVRVTTEGSLGSE